MRGWTPLRKRKKKKHIAWKGVIVQNNIELRKPEDGQPLVHKQSRLRNIPQPPYTRIPSDVTTSTRDTSTTPSPKLSLETFIHRDHLIDRRVMWANIHRGNDFFDVLEGKYIDVMQTLCFHEFDKFTRPRGPSIPFPVTEIYAAYGELVPKNKKQEGSSD